MNICAKCSFVRHVQANPAAPDAWYNFKCAAPPVQAEEGINPLTGAKGNWKVSSNGTRYFDSDPKPYCSEVNPQGQCQFYVAGDGRFLHQRHNDKGD